MKLNQPVARRYARALLAHARHAKAVPETTTAASALLEAMQQTPLFAKQLSNPVLPNAEKIKTLHMALPKAAAAQPLLDMFQLLSANHRLNVLPAVLRAFMLEAEQAEGIVRAKVTSAAPLTDAQKKQATSLAARMGNIKEDCIKLEEYTNPALMAGACVQVGSQQVDLTLQNKLNRLHAAMTH